MAWWIRGLAWLLLGVVLTIAAVWSWCARINPYWGIMGLILVVFSLRRSYKASVEVWRGRLSKKAEISVASEKDTYLP